MSDYAPLRNPLDNAFAKRVLELHEPIDGFVGDPSHWECSICGDGRGPLPYPCPTVQAIKVEAE